MGKIAEIIASTTRMVRRLKTEGCWVHGVDIKLPEYEGTADEVELLDLRIYVDDCVEGLLRLMASGYRDPLYLSTVRLISINDSWILPVRSPTNVEFPACDRPRRHSSQLAAPTKSRANVLGVGIHAIDLPSAASITECAVREGTKGYVCVTSVHCVMEAQRDSQFRDIPNHALLVTPDGTPTDIGSLAASCPASCICQPDSNVKSPSHATAPHSPACTPQCHNPPMHGEWREAWG